MEKLILKDIIGHGVQNAKLYKCREEIRNIIKY